MAHPLYASLGLQLGVVGMFQGFYVSVLLNLRRSEVLTNIAQIRYTWKLIFGLVLVRIYITLKIINCDSFNRWIIQQSGSMDVEYRFRTVEYCLYISTGFYLV